MPNTPYAKVLVRKNGGSLTSGRVLATTGDSIALSEENSSGVYNRRFEIYQYPPGFACPSGWTNDNGRYYSTSPNPDAFLATLWGKYLLAHYVNNGWVTGVTDHVDKSTLLSAPSPGGLYDLAPQEQSWAEDQRANLRVLENVVAGGSSVTFKAVKGAVRAATETALPANTLNPATNVYTATANGALPPVNGIALTLGQKFLLKDEAAQQNNGPVVILSLGSGGSKFSLQRTTDWDSSTEVDAGSGVVVQEGSNAGFWYITNTTPPVINTTAMPFKQSGGASSAGTGGVTVRAVVPTNVATLSSFSTSFAGLTLVAGNRLLLPRQTTLSECYIYIVGTPSGGNAPLTLSTETVTPGEQIGVLEGNNGYANTTWTYNGGSDFRPTIGTALDLVIGQNGSEISLGQDTLAGGTFFKVTPEILRGITVNAGSTVVVWSFDCVSRNITSGTLAAAPNVIARWDTDAKRVWASRPATVIPDGTTPVLIEQGPSNIHDGAAGANGYLTLLWAFNGGTPTTLELRVTNNRASAATVDVLEHFLAAG